MNRLLVSGLLALALSACGITSVGVPCVDRSDCEPAQECVKAPGGFCTRGCTEAGQARDCPSGTVCTFFGRDQLVCSTPCQVDADCRVNFECVLTAPGSTISACRPTAAASQ
ncbi:MAG: hypothetical protein ACOZQL_25790 [Myxococcota bacterium]